MKLFLNLLFMLFLFTIVQIGSAVAQEGNKRGGVFDLGDVLIMEKGDEINRITSTDTVSLDDIEMQGSKTVADVLEYVLGIDVQTGNKGHSTLKLRGFDQRDVKVLIDGVPAHETYFGSMDLDMIPIDAVAKIKVIKGASSVLYGPNTMGGVVNIITKKGTKDPYTSFSTSFGQNSTRNFVANHGAAVGKFNYWITASRQKTDGFELSDDFDPNNTRTGLESEYNEDGGIRNLSHYTKNTINSKIGYEFDKDSKLYLSLDYHENEKGAPTSSDRYWAFDEWNQWHVNLVGEHDVTDKLSMKARVYYVDHEDTLEDVSWDADHTTKKKWFEQSSYDDYTLGGEVQAYLDAGRAGLIKMGVSYIKDNHRQQDFYDTDTRDVVNNKASAGYQPEEEYETDIYSIGIEDEVRITDRLILNAGISFDTQDPVKAYGGIDREETDSWNPQAGISFDATPELNLYASVGKKTRFPQMQELYSNLSGGDRSLKPQETIAYEVGATHRLNPDMDISVAAFLNDVENRIIRERVNSVSQYVNKGESTIKGFEASLTARTDWDLEIGLGYTFLSSKDKEDSQSPEQESDYMPGHKATLDVRYAFDFGLSAVVQIIYTGEQIEYDDDDKKVELDDFFIVNAKLSQAVSLSEKLNTDFFVEVKNLLDEDYDEGDGPMPGRSILAGVTLRF